MKNNCVVAPAELPGVMTVSATGSGGTCYGDSGGPHFLGGTDSHTVVSITVIGDAWCKATDKTYRLDTPAAREFLAGFGVSLP